VGIIKELKERERGRVKTNSKKKGSPSVHGIK
jgi:hypothetical protein